MGGCNSFAYILSDTIFGKDAPVTKHQNFDQIKVGDVIWLKNSANGFNHVFVVTEVDSDSNIYRTCEGNVSDTVSWMGWGEISFLSEPECSSTYIYSRY